MDALHHNTDVNLSFIKDAFLHFQRSQQKNSKLGIPVIDKNARKKKQKKV